MDRTTPGRAPGEVDMTTLADIDVPRIVLADVGSEAERRAVVTASGRRSPAAIRPFAAGTLKKPVSTSPEMIAVIAAGAPV